MFIIGFNITRAGVLMNQSIIFPDLQSWDADKQQIVFPVQIEGVTIFCTISLHKLEALSDQTVITPNMVLNVFNTCRFDIEDLVESLVKQDNLDKQGHIHLG